MERLSPEDQVMLWPDELWPQDIGALAVLDGTPLRDADGRFRIDTVRSAIARRLHLVPRFRQLLVIPPARLGGPLWVDAPAFDLTDHVQAMPLPAPGDEARLLLTVEQLRKRRLDRSRPLWEMWFLTGLPDGRVGLFVRMHHTIADGMASVVTIGRFLDATADALPPASPPWVPAPAPTAQELRDDKRRREARRRHDRLSLLAHPVTSVRQLKVAWPAIRELLAEPPLPPTSLDRVVGADRNIALVRSDLDAVKKIAHIHHATVNDVLLAASAGGLRQLLTSRGEPVEGAQLRIYVPVSLHQEPRGRARGNLIAQMVVPLFIGISDPARRLELIAHETAHRKTRVRPSLGKVPHRGIVGRTFLKLVRQQRVNVTSADLPGPDKPQYLAGARVLEVFPMVQLLGTVSLAVGAMSYAGQFNIMIVADHDAYPDLEVFTTGLQDEIRRFALAAGTPISARTNR